MVFVGVAAVFAGIIKLVDNKQKARDAERQARYVACLERTTPAVCELHLVRFPTSSSSSSGDGVGLVISPEGKIGIGIGLGM